jgi:hypothetical protein
MCDDGPLEHNAAFQHSAEKLKFFFICHQNGILSLKTLVFFLLFVRNEGFLNIRSELICIVALFFHYMQGKKYPPLHLLRKDKLLHNCL